MAQAAVAADETLADGDGASAVAASDPAFEGLYRRYAADVYRYTLAVLQNPADAEDVTQTTFLNAFRALQRGLRPVAPRNWLIKIAHNACRMRHRTSTRRPQEVPLDGHLQRLEVPDEAAPSVRDVLRALGKLPFNQRAALVMRELDGRSYREIAATLGVSVAAVETLIFRARRTLRAQRAALRALGAVQLPASLASFLESGTAAGTGGTILGVGFAAKAVALLTAGVVAGTAGYGAVKAVTSKPSPQKPAPQVNAPAAWPRPEAPHVSRAGPGGKVAANGQRARGNGEAAQPSPRAGAVPAGGRQGRRPCCAGHSLGRSRRARPAAGAPTARTAEPPGAAEPARGAGRDPAASEPARPSDALDAA